MDRIHRLEAEVEAPAQIAFLRHCGDPEWKEKKHVEHTGARGAPIAHEVKNALIDKLIAMMVKPAAEPLAIDVAGARRGNNC